MRGGKRDGAGRKKTNKETVVYYRRIPADWVKILDKVLKELKEKEL